MTKARANRLADYTTRIGVQQTAHECMTLLGRAGADEVLLRMRDGEPAGLGFVLDTPHGKRRFVLPVRPEGAQRALDDPREKKS